MFCMSYHCFTVLHVLWPGSCNHLWNGLMCLSLFFCFTDHISLVFRRLQTQFASRCQQNMSITNSLHFCYFFPIWVCFFFFWSPGTVPCRHCCFLYQTFTEYKDTKLYCNKTPSSATVHTSVNIVKRPGYLETQQLSTFFTFH